MLDDLKRHHPLGQKFQRPACTTLRLGTTGDGDQLGLLLAIEHPFDTGTNLLLALQCRVQPFFDEPLAERLDRSHRYPERRGDLRVLQLRPHLRFIRRQQDVRMTNPVGAGLPRPDELFQPLTLIGLQPNHISLHVDPP